MAHGFAERAIHVGEKRIVVRLFRPCGEISLARNVERQVQEAVIREIGKVRDRTVRVDVPLCREQHEMHRADAGAYQVFRAALGVLDSEVEQRQPRAVAIRRAEKRQINIGMPLHERGQELRQPVAGQAVAAHETADRALKRCRSACLHDGVFRRRDVGEDTLAVVRKLGVAAGMREEFKAKLPFEPLHSAPDRRAS